jgi:hypothetical protein
VSDVNKKFEVIYFQLTVNGCDCLEMKMGVMNCGEMMRNFVCLYPTQKEITEK